MSRNVTLRLEDAVLRRAKHLAVDSDQSLSEWVGGLVTQAVQGNPRYQAAKDRALKRLETGFHLGGKPLSREQAHVR